LGAPESVSRRVVFDTSTVISALLFSSGRLAWLRQHWCEAECVPLISPETAAEITPALRYPKFKLSLQDTQELLADYIPYCEAIKTVRTCLCVCRDPSDQPFLDLAESGEVDFLVSSDRDLLVLSGRTSFSIETPETYRRRVAGVR
jgi:uncharacterized protein